MPPELIFFAVIIFFSVIDGIARRRKQQQGGALTLPEEGQVEWDPDVEVPPYDGDAAYDEEDDENIPADPLPRYTQPYGSAQTAGRRGATSSEGLIPSDIWEEIAGLAQGRPPAPPTPAPMPQPEPELVAVHFAEVCYGRDAVQRACCCVLSVSRVGA